MDSFWKDFEFPELGEEVPGAGTNQGGSTPDIGSMSTCIKKRAMVVFLVVDVSGSMKDARIGAVNDAIRNLLPILREREEDNTNAEVRIAILEFSNDAHWKTLSPQPVSTYKYEDITYVYGGTNYGKMFHELNEKMSSKAFLKSSSGSYTPLVVLMTDGKPSDVALYQEELELLKQNSWFRYATKAGIAIEEGAMSEECVRVLTEFTGNSKMVLAARDTNMLSKQIKLVTLTGVDFVTQQGSVQQAGSPEDTEGSTAAGAPAAGTGRISLERPGGNGPAGAGGISLERPSENGGIGNGNTDTSAASPALDPRAGADPVIPGLGDIDWDNDFPTFG